MTSFSIVAALALILFLVLFLVCFSIDQIDADERASQVKRQKRFARYWDFADDIATLSGSAFNKSLIQQTENWASGLFYDTQARLHKAELLAVEEAVLRAEERTDSMRGRHECRCDDCIPCWQVELAEEALESLRSSGDALHLALLTGATVAARRERYEAALAWYR